MINIFVYGEDYMFLLENVNISSLCYSSQNKRPEIIQNKKTFCSYFLSEKL